MKSLAQQTCAPDLEGQPGLSKSAAGGLIKQLSGWTFTQRGKAVAKDFKMKNFLAAIDFIRKIATVAQREDHHPDLHLTGYRHLRIELSTHSAGGLSRNDFILAAKIDRLPKKLKK